MEEENIHNITITTTDKETADKLRNLGFEEIEHTQSRWVFKNT